MENFKATYATIYAGTSKKVRETIEKMEIDSLSKDEINDLTILLNLKGMILKERGKIVNLTDRKRNDGEKSIDNY